MVWYLYYRNPKLFGFNTSIGCFQYGTRCCVSLWSYLKKLNPIIIWKSRLILFWTSETLIFYINRIYLSSFYSVKNVYWVVHGFPMINSDLVVVSLYVHTWFTAVLFLNFEKMLKLKTVAWLVSSHVLRFYLVAKFRKFSSTALSFQGGQHLDA